MTLVQTRARRAWSPTVLVLLALVITTACRSSAPANSSGADSELGSAEGLQSAPVGFDDGSVPVAQASDPGYRLTAADSGSDAVTDLVSDVDLRPNWLDEGGPPSMGSGSSGTRHVDCETGDDTNPATAEQPVRSLSAVGPQPEGTDLVIRGLCENQQLRISWGGTESDPVIVDGYEAVLRASGAAIGHGAIVEVEGDHVEVWGNHDRG